MAHLPAPPTRGSHARIQFVLTSLAMCALVATAGWLSDLRAVFHGTIIVLSVAAFLPLLLALALVLIFLGMSAIAILSGDPDAAPLASDAYAASEGLAAFFRRVFVPLSSLGYDGKESGDDLCLSGSSRARAALDRLGDAASTIHDLLTGSLGDPGLHHWWSALRATTCPPDSRTTH